MQEERAVLRPLPLAKLDVCTRLEVRVGPSSTIRVKHKVYSVNSRLIKELVTIRLYSEYLEVWYGQAMVDKIPRLRGSIKHRIQYRHIIDWLVRKPGALDNYRYRSDLFPTSRFRVAYDSLRAHHSGTRTNKEYLAVLQLAAMENEAAVDDALRWLINKEEQITADRVAAILHSDRQPEAVTDVFIQAVALVGYDQLLQEAYE